MSLVLDGFSVSLDGRELAVLDAEVKRGKVLSVMGPSGVGKSSLLLAMAGLLEAPFTVAGRLELNGRDLLATPSQERALGLMFQDPLLFPHMSVLGNVMFAVNRSGRDGERRNRGRRAELALSHLKRVDMHTMATRDPDTLSGGQKSRVALARTLAAEPQALLLDEPFASLDQALRSQIRRIVFSLAAQDGLPVVMVSHDPADAAAAGGPVVSLMA
ncbi:MAG: ATP-binding cassette domain-containing protein [Devosia sp.]